MWGVSWLTVLVTLGGCVQGLDNGLLLTPPMGWMAWERFRCNTDCVNDPKNCISERLIMEMADRLVEDGWVEFGYNYVNIDDCWMDTKRDAKGRLTPDPIRFPSGIKALAKYVHSRGLRLGIYSDMGPLTCGGFPGTPLDKVITDAQTFASWDVDMLKLDGCYSNSSIKALGYPLMSRALNATGRPIAYSCSWPAYEGGLPPKVNYTLLMEICNLWRNYGDISDSWDSVRGIMDWFSNNQRSLQPAGGPGHWNDPDMLIIGDFSLSYDQSKSQMAIWAIMAAPLFMSNDLRTISYKARSILQNRRLIHINQDPLGSQGLRLFRDHRCHIEVWLRNLSSSAVALAFLSRRTDRPFLYETSLALLNITSPPLLQALDVFTEETQWLTPGSPLKVRVNPGGVVMFHLSPLDKLHFLSQGRKPRLKDIL